jgi:hypothetical protein
MFPGNEAARSLVGSACLVSVPALLETPLPSHFSFETKTACSPQRSKETEELLVSAVGHFRCSCEDFSDSHCCMQRPKSTGRRSAIDGRYAVGERSSHMQLQ